jgi:hypothetical protein
MMKLRKKLNDRTLGEIDDRLSMEHSEDDRKGKKRVKKRGN